MRGGEEREGRRVRDIKGGTWLRIWLTGLERKSRMSGPVIILLFLFLFPHFLFSAATRPGPVPQHSQRSLFPFLVSLSPIGRSSISRFSPSPPPLFSLEPVAA